MSIVRRTNKQIREGRGRADHAKLEATTEDMIAEFMHEDDSDTQELGEPRFVPPRTDVRALRERLGLSQSAFAKKYFLSVRTVQQWEHGQREPSEPARVLLYAIARDPRTMERVLHKSR